MNLRFLKKDENGFTLIEVLISITILGIVATSFLSFFNNAYSYTKINEDKTVGINVARNILNFFEQQDYSKIKKAYLSNSIPEKIITIENCSDQVQLKVDSPSEDVFSDLEACKRFLTPEKNKVNNVVFTPTVKYTRDLSTTETKPNLENQLIGVEIKVEWNNQSTSVKGLISK